MLYRYQLQAIVNDKVVFEGNFSSLNKMVKVACCFDTSVAKLESYDSLFGKTIPVYSLITEFETECTGI